MLKKTRKTAEYRPSEPSRPGRTTKENPLFIQGHNVFDKLFREHTIHTQICDLVRESFESLSEPYLKVIFQVGRLLSVLQSRSIFLPVENEAVLDFDFNRVKFVPNVSNACLDSLYLRVFASKSDFSKMEADSDYLEVELYYSKGSGTARSSRSKAGGVEVGGPVNGLLEDAAGSGPSKKGAKNDGINRSIIYRIPFNYSADLDFGSLQSYINNYMDSLIVYRPESEYHFRVITNSTMPLNAHSNDGSSVNSGSANGLEGNITKILFRHLRTYKTSRTEGVKFVKFNLEVIDQWDVPVNLELCKLSVNEMIHTFYETFVASNSSSNYSYLDVDNSDESKVKIIQFASSPPTPRVSACSETEVKEASSADEHIATTDASETKHVNEEAKSLKRMRNETSQLFTQYKKMTLSKPNRFEYIISILESNTRMLLDIFNSGLDMGEVSDFYPNLMGDTAQFAQIHYDTRKVVRQQESAIEALRKYNNLVKRAMILLNIRPQVSVLDLACGHGQDLDKYNTSGIRRLMGIDISLREINEARRRFAQRKRVLSFSAEFHHGNLLDPKVYTMFVKNTKFDVVSIQLAIHYILEDERSSTFILQNIFNSLSEGGLFIGSTVCCDRLALELSQNMPENQDSDWSFGNPIFKITLDQKAAEGLKKTEAAESFGREEIREALNSTWGLKYHFFLMESIDESEYVVPWKAFVDLCSKIGFRLVESLTFPEYLEKAKGLVRGRSLGLPASVYENFDKHLASIASFQFSHDQARVFSLYKVFIFEKIKLRDKLYIQGVKIKR